MTPTRFDNYVHRTMSRSRRRTNGDHRAYSSVSLLISVAWKGFDPDWWPNNARERRIRRAR